MISIVKSYLLFKTNNKIAHVQGEGDFKQNNMKSYPSLGRWPALHLKITSFGGFFLIFPEFPCIHMCICALRTIYFLCFAQMEKYGLFFFFLTSTSLFLRDA